MKTCITIIFLLLLATLSAQNNTIFFDKNWKISSSETAFYYQIKPLKVTTKDAVDYKIKNIDSLFVIKNYYLNNNQLQFQGYSSDYKAEQLFGKAEWFNNDGKMIDGNNFNYKKNTNNSKFKIPEWPILYLNYSIANKSLFTGGLEFCLTQSKNKLFLGVGYGITNSYNGKYYGLPDVHLSYNTQSLLFVKAGSSSKNAYAVGGLTVFNMMDLGLGYSFPYNKEKIPTYEGFTASLSFRFTKNKDVYTKLNIIQ